METILDSPVTPQTHSGYAGFWLRFVAWIIDALVLAVVSSILSTVFFGAGAFMTSDPTAMFAMLMPYFSMNFVIQWLYYALLESSKNQATLEKMALGLKVTDLENQKVSFLRATARYLCMYLSFFTLLIGYILAGLTPKKQALHDLIAGTLVVKK